MSDVVLVYPATGLDVKNISVTLPLSVLATAAPVRGEFSVRIIDQRVDPDWRATLTAELRSKPLCVGVSSMTGTQIYFGLEASRLTRELSPETPIVWGGVHPTLAADTTIAHPLVDFVVKGEAEATFPPLLRALADRRRDYQHIPGLMWKTDGRVIGTPEPDPVDLNVLPPIPFDLVDVEHYVRPSHFLYPGVKRMLPFQASRGCPFKCTFCCQPSLTKKYRLLKPEILVEQTLDMVRRFKLDMIAFYDEEFFAHTKWANQVAELINGRYLWWTQTRMADLLRQDLPKLRRCGLHVIVPGLESGSDRVLKYIHKQETTEEYLEANRRLAPTGIISQYNFIIGFPGETRAEVFETIDLTMKLLEENPNASVHSYSILTPLPGTVMYDQAVEEWGFPVPQTLEEWSGISRRRLPTPWVRKDATFYRHLMYSSVLLDKGKQTVQEWWWFPKFVFDLYAWWIMFRWRKRRFGFSPDIWLAQLVHRLISPVDFMDLDAKTPAPAKAAR